MGKRISIYMSDEMFKSIQATAKKDGRSVSNYLVQLHKMTMRKDPGFIEEAGSISEEVYTNIETGNKPAQPDKFESHKSNLDTKKRVKKIINDVPLVQPASNFFNPQTKGKK